MTCNDTDICTSGDVCDGKGLCKGAPRSCADGNPCTSDACVPATAKQPGGCVSLPNTLACTDGSVCTLQDACSDGACKPGAVLDCDDGNACTLDVCAAKSGCAAVPTAGSCDDGDPCTVSDACKNAACAGGTPLACTDNKPCTEDICKPGVGCQHVNIGGTCDDGDACTLAGSCASGSCSKGPARMWTADLGDAGLNRPDVVLLDATGMVVVARNAGSLSQRRFVRYSRAGELLSKQTIQDHFTPQAVVAAAAGGWLLVATAQETSNTPGGVGVARMSASGDMAWHKVLNTPPLVTARAAARTPSGAVVAAYRLENKACGTTSQYQFPGFLTVGTDGTTGPYIELSGCEAPAQLPNAVTTTASGLAFAGFAYTTNPTLYRRWLTRTDATGKAIWTRRDTEGDRFLAYALLADGDELIAAGMVGVYATPDRTAWIAHFDTKGQGLWDRRYEASNYDGFDALTAVPGGFVAAGHDGGGTSASYPSRPWVVRVDGQGALLWSRSFAQGTARMGAIAVGGDANSVFVAISGVVNTNQIVSELRALDGFGNASCVGSGGCAGKVVDDCKDGSPCTSDACDAAHSGCWHAAWPNGTQCGDGLKCTASVCK